MAAALFSLDRVTFSLATRPLVRDATWQVNSGQCWAVCGPNGCGKSALCAGVAGHLVVSAGRMRHHFLESDPHCRDSIYGVLPRGSLELVSPELARQTWQPARSFHQARWHASVDHGPSVRELFTLAQLENLHPFRIDLPAIDPQEFNRARDVAIERVGITELLDRRLHELSSGEWRQVLLARALARTPRLLILDDALTGLDVASHERLRNVLEELIRQGVHLVLSLRLGDQLPSVVSHVLYLAQGRVTWQGPRSASDDAEPSLSERESSALAGELSASPVAVPPAEGVAPSGGEVLPGHGEPIIRMRQVRVAYGQSVVLRELDWTVHQGENWAVVGANGAGKSTLMSLVLGDNLQVYSNDILVFGRRLGSDENLWSWRARLGWMGPELDTHLPLQAFCSDVVCSGYTGTLGLSADSTTEQRERSQALLTELGLEQLATRRVAEISPAQRKMICLARALVAGPKLLLLDEPCQGLDSAHVWWMRAKIEAALTEQARSVVYVTHRWWELPRCITHVLELDRGRVVRRGRIR